MAIHTRNRDELALRVATSMNLLRPGEDLSFRYAAQMIAAYTELYAELLDDKLAYWLIDEIPLAVFQRIAWMTALQVAPAFGAMPVILAALAEPSSSVAMDTFREQLRRHISKNSAFETLEIDYF